MKKILLLAAALVVGVSAFSKDIRSVVFSTNLHCENCVKKVTENISYIKGVKDLKVSLEKQEIFVKFDADKTSSEKIASEIRKIGYKAFEKKEVTPKELLK